MFPPCVLVLFRFVLFLPYFPSTNSHCPSSLSKNAYISGRRAFHFVTGNPGAAAVECSDFCFDQNDTTKHRGTVPPRARYSSASDTISP